MMPNCFHYHIEEHIKIRSLIKKSLHFYQLRSKYYHWRTTGMSSVTKSIKHSNQFCT